MNERVTRSPAEVYDEFFVPALFQQWGNVVADAAGVGLGQRVLDVACGTGVLACAAAERVGNRGTVVGLDPNEEMLTVARRKNSSIEWRDGRAESLPFPDESFDAVASQFGFMFFEDRHATLREMIRVLRPGGRLAVAVCDSLDHSPGYAAVASCCNAFSVIAWRTRSARPSCLATRNGCSPCAPTRASPTRKSRGAKGRCVSRRSDR
jgi:ubiquinone/menaquinone biosynthesis C-methylase UbiE